MSVGTAMGNEKFFTYSYEPEAMPQGTAEFEQWVTLRAGRDAKVGQENYTRWDIREELEYGATDHYTVALYLNMKSENFRDPKTKDTEESFDFEGVSLENRYMVLNPAEHAVGLTLYLEPSYLGSEAEIEEKILIGQRHGDWKWAINLVNATEWNFNDHEYEGEFQFTFGITRHLNKRWSVGLELVDDNEIPQYEVWENTAVFLGPVVTFTQENWWATLTILPQVYGTTFGGKDPDGVSWLELEGHEKVDARLILGISF